jgi:hypothetical protein
MLNNHRFEVNRYGAAGTWVPRDLDSTGVTNSWLVPIRFSLTLLGTSASASRRTLPPSPAIKAPART